MTLLQPVYTYVSSSYMLLQAAVQQLKQTYSQANRHSNDFNSDACYADNADINAMLNIARTMPIMAAQRFVAIAHIHKLPAAAHAALIAYLKNPNPTCVLCLSGEKFDARSKLHMAIATHGNMQIIEPPHGAALAHFLTNYAKQHAYHIDKDAALLLIDTVGDDIDVLLGNLEKAALYVGERRHISCDDVATAVLAIRVQHVSTLQHAIGAGNFSAATQAVHHMLASGLHGLLLLNIITKHVRQMLQQSTKQYSTHALQQSLERASFVEIQLKLYPHMAALLCDDFLLDLMQIKKPAPNVYHNVGTTPLLPSAR